MIECCIFDLDGTLLNTLKTITYYVNKTLSDFGVEPISEDDCRAFIGNGAKHLITSSLQSKGVFDEGLAQQVLSAYNVAYNSNTSYLTAEYRGITDMLRSLACRGIPSLLRKIPQIPPMKVKQNSGRISLTTYLTTTSNFS